MQNWQEKMEPDYPRVTLRPQGEPPEVPPRRAEWLRHLPAILFALTCLSTLDLGGPVYAVALMTILLAHELGHYLQARRYGVPTSLPYFLPMPAMLSPFGTMGAVLAMRPGSAQTRGLFDIAVSGPIAGLVPSLIATVWGLHLSDVVPLVEEERGPTLGAPPLFRWLAGLMIEVPDGHSILLHPMAYAGWVGLFITALNLMPIGQLDGGHILYALAPKWAHRTSWLVVLGAWVWMLWEQYWMWTLMLLLLAMIGFRHPPVRSGGPALGLGRRILGWATLAAAPLIFTPKPFQF